MYIYEMKKCIRDFGNLIKYQNMFIYIIIIIKIKYLV